LWGLQIEPITVDKKSMVSTMGFVGADVDTLLKYRDVLTTGSDIAQAAQEFLAELTPIGDPFEAPWKLVESLGLLDSWVPEPLTHRLLNPGGSVPENHLEAIIVSLAREAGVYVEPLTRQDMARLQHGVRQLDETGGWGRQSSHPWDTLTDDALDEWRFYALCVPA